MPTRMGFKSSSTESLRNIIIKHKHSHILHVPTSHKETKEHNDLNKLNTPARYYFIHAHTSYACSRRVCIGTMCV